MAEPPPNTTITAEEVEAQAEKAQDPEVKASWRQIAKDWVSMAETS